MARILELVLIANALGGIAGYLGFKVRRAKKATRAGINKAAGAIGVEVFHEDDGIYRTKSGRVLTDEEIERLAKEAEEGYSLAELTQSAEGTPQKRSRLARIGDKIS